MKLLSLCIPTYNHAGYLEQVLARLVSLSSVKTGNVEVVVSDNASTDSTQEVGERYASEYPDIVRYFRNANNVCDENFGLSLSRGTGLFLKLANDTLLFTEEGLARMLETIERHRDERPVLFFPNKGLRKTELDCKSFDEFFGAVSFNSTWIGGFGIWRTDDGELDTFSRLAELKLTQVDVLCRALHRKRHAVVSDNIFCESIPRDSIGGYNLAQVFGHNYLSILKPYVDGGDLSRSEFRREKYRMLRFHILPFYLSRSKKFHFPKTGYVRFLARWYWDSAFYWLTVPFVALFALSCRLFR